MSETTEQGLSVTIANHVAIVEIRRPPNNFFDFNLIRQIADTYELLDNDDACRAIVLCSKGKHFCAGADFSAREAWFSYTETSINALLGSAIVKSN